MEQVKSVVAGILLLAGTVAASSAYAYSEIADEVGQQGRVSSASASARYRTMKVPIRTRGP